MPELPEVQTVVTTVRPHLVGATIRSVALHRPDIVTPPGCPLESLLTGRTVTAVDRRAKRIVFTLDDGNRFYIHLGMTGRLTVEPRSAVVLPHTHLILELQWTADINPTHFVPVDSTGQERFTAPGGDVPAPSPGTPGEDRAGDRLAKSHSPIDQKTPSPALPRSTGRGGNVTRRHEAVPTPLAALTTHHLRFRDPRRFGGVWWVGTDPADDRLGPEPLTLRPARLARQLARTTRAVKTALLDQSFVAGLGNIYVDESLHRAAIHPKPPPPTCPPPRSPG